jgi:hypothetical protein
VLYYAKAADEKAIIIFIPEPTASWITMKVMTYIREPMRIKGKH